MLSMRSLMKCSGQRMRLIATLRLWTGRSPRKSRNSRRSVEPIRPIECQRRDAIRNLLDKLLFHLNAPPGKAISNRDADTLTLLPFELILGRTSLERSRRWIAR